MPAVGGFTELLAELQATPAATETVSPPTPKSAPGTNDPGQAADQSIQTNTASIVGATPAHTQSAPAAAGTTEVGARKPVERSPADVPSPSERHAGEPAIAPPPVPAPKASSQTARRALSPPAATQAVISKDDLASAEQHAPAAAHDDRKAHTESAAQDLAKQDQTQPALSPQPIVAMPAPAPPPVNTTEATSNAPKLQVEVVSDHRTSASDSSDPRQQTELPAVTDGSTPAVIASAPQFSQPFAPEPAVAAPPAPQQAVQKAAETVAARIGRAVQDGNHVLTMQLHPAELGRVEVRLSFHDGGIGVQMTLDRPETYDAFTRNRDAMEQHLANSGINLTTGGLDLRFGQQPDRSVPQPPMHAVRVPLSGETAFSASPPPVRSMRNGLIDILA
jgi:flagellar hook-length control protein FliK